MTALLATDASHAVTRRTALRWGSEAAIGAFLGAGVGCSTKVVTPVAYPPGYTLAPVKVSWERIIRRVVGLRPFRPAGFVLRADRLGDKVLVHNYGHGGGGITLSWGSSALAVREADAVALTGERRAAILGCGVMGLTTARLLQRRGWAVTIYARELPPQTTSNVAGGQWTPTSVFDTDAITPAFRTQFNEVTRLAFRSFQDLAGPEYGVRWIDNYYLSGKPWSDEPEVFKQLPDVFPGATELAPDEHPFDAPYALRVRTMLIEPATFLNTLLRDVRIAGGKVVVGEIRDRTQVTGLSERVVVNCTGLGSGALFGDSELMPVKGQLTFLFPQPEVDYLAISDGLYMFPRSDGILLGGTFDRGNADLAFDFEAERRILNGHRRLFSSMRSG